jgi:hypothetical protein
VIVFINLGTCQEYAMLECTEGARRKYEYANVEAATIS